MKAAVAWTTDLVETLRQRVDDMASNTAIARELGLTKGQIAGKINRLGLSGARRETSYPRRPRRDPRTIAVRLHAIGIGIEPMEPELFPAPSEGPSPGNDAPLVAETAAHPILTLEARCCRWPIGDPRDSDFRYCLEPRARVATPRGFRLLPYCEHHARLSKQGSQL
jgi:GcrA cell cycle regulator